MAGGPHQLVGGASLELCRGRKTEYLDIPLKDSIKGWHQGEPLQVPPPRSGRQPDVRTPSWVESPTPSEITEAKVLLAEVCLLKDRGLTAEAVVADFVSKNIQPLKDMAYLAYLYSGINDSTRVTNKRILTEDLMSQLDMILRNRVSNAYAPVAYSAWNLPPVRPFSEFVSNPPASDGSLGLRVRPSPEDIEALIAPLRSLLDDERQTHFEMPASTDDAEIDAVLSLLAGESSDSTHAGHWISQLWKNLVRRWRPKNLSVFAQSVYAEWAARLRLLRKKGRRGSFDDCHAWTRGQILLLRFVMRCRQRSFLRLMPRVVITHKLLSAYLMKMKKKRMKSHWSARTTDTIEVARWGSDIPSLALSTLISLQGLSISDFDQALEEVVPEDMLSEPTINDISAVCSEVPDGGLSLLDSAGQEVTRVVSRASSTLEGSLQCQDAGLSHPTPMEATEEPSALGVATAEDPTPEGGAGSYPAPEGVAGSDPALVGSASYDPSPEGVQVGSLSHASMDVHVGLSPPRSDGATTVHASTILDAPITLEVGELDARSLMSIGGVEITLWKGNRV
jgi:hypothetical protein